ncbi:hypothetical protein MXD63_28610, partial [Frankia sp. Cpl3]|nr:hypothetical protein [Frankia sp. Cpl3]
LPGVAAVQKNSRLAVTAVGSAAVRTRPARRLRRAAGCPAVADFEPFECLERLALLVRRRGLGDRDGWPGAGSCVGSAS